MKREAKAKTKNTGGKEQSSKEIKTESSEALIFIVFSKSRSKFGYLISSQLYVL